jgi:hypothetical protein
MRQAERVSRTDNIRDASWCALLVSMALSVHGLHTTPPGAHDTGDRVTLCLPIHVACTALLALF